MVGMWWTPLSVCDCGGMLPLQVVNEMDMLLRGSSPQHNIIHITQAGPT